MDSVHKKSWLLHANTMKVSCVVNIWFPWFWFTWLVKTEGPNRCTRIRNSQELVNGFYWPRSVRKMDGYSLTSPYFVAATTVSLDARAFGAKMPKQTNAANTAFSFSNGDMELKFVCRIPTNG